DDEYQEDSDSTFISRRRVNRYKNRPKPNINLSDDNSEQSVDEPSESSEFTTEDDNIS
ncbi:17420_t:CDS:1, partial [Funneliformis geosporum]